jgi:hypothetical protein
MNLGLQKYQILDCPSSKNLTKQEHTEFQEAQVAMKLLSGTNTKQLSQPKLMSIALASYCQDIKGSASATSASATCQRE